VLPATTVSFAGLEQDQLVTDLSARDRVMIDAGTGVDN